MGSKHISILQSSKKEYHLVFANEEILSIKMIQFTKSWFMSLSEAILLFDSVFWNKHLTLEIVGYGERNKNQWKINWNWIGL